MLTLLADPDGFKPDTHTKYYNTPLFYRAAEMSLGKYKPFCRLK